MDDVRLAEQGLADLAAYGSVSIAFPVTDRWGDGPVVPPVWKDYDAILGNTPTDWPGRFDVSRWRFVAAFAGDRRVGGATVVTDPAGLDVAAGRSDTAILWDLRVAPGDRGRGVGRALLGWAEDVARAAGRRWMTIETQDANAAACRFYAGRGYTVVRTDPDAYPGLPGETQLMWARRLNRRDGDR